MATIVNNPNGNDSGGAAGWLIGLVILILVVLAAIFLLPRLANTQNGAPAGGTEQGTTGADQGVIPPVVNVTTVNSTTTVTGTTTP